MAARRLGRAARRLLVPAPDPGGHMPNFYFDVREGELLLRDEDGLDLPDIAAAEHEAADTVAMLARELLPRSRCRPISVEVRDSGGRRRVVVTCALMIWRLGSS